MANNPPTADDPVVGLLRQTVSTLQQSQANTQGALAASQQALATAQGAISAQQTQLAEDAKAIAGLQALIADLVPAAPSGA